VTQGERRVSVSGGDLSVVDIGDPNAPAVLFVHGLPTSSFLWRAFGPAMPPAMRAIVPDLLGAGASDQPSGVPLGMQAQAEYLAELLDALGVGRAAVVGHAHGGGIAQLLALRGRADALVLVDSIALGRSATEPMRELLDLAARKDADLDAVIGQAFDAGMTHRDRLQAQAVDEYRRPFAGEDGRAALARFATAFEGDGVAGVEEDLAELQIPVFLVWGEEDTLTPPALGERLNDVIPRSSLALLPGCGHFLPEEAPQTVVPLLYEYLRGAYAGLPHAHETGPTTIELGRRYRGAEDQRRG
jgi:pimeloyl-ACP methyl ester carboxylesterase